jgi:serine phosphatase RsbU (regulator of sigma subunit)
VLQRSLCPLRLPQIAGLDVAVHCEPFPVKQAGGDALADGRCAFAAITLAVAGHFAPLIVRADGTVEAAPARGTALGAVADPAFERCEMHLAAGDTIISHTDRIVDATLDRVHVDEQRVAEMLLGAAHASAQSLVDRLGDAVARIDRPLRDDVAIIALRRTPE